MAENLKLMFEGFGQTLLLFILTLVIALPIGLLITGGSMFKFKPIKWLVKGFVWIIRGTPLMLQIIVVFYVPGLLWGATLPSRMFAVVVAFVINYSCYFSEIYRGGIESISQGQYEACQVLGMSKIQTFFRVILPQVIKRIIPSMGNEIITLVKDTSLARVIAVGELLLVSYNIMATKGVIWPLFAAGLFYLIFNGILSVLFSFIEKKLNYYRG